MIPLHYGEPEGIADKRHPILNEDEVEVGVAFSDESAGTHKAHLFGDDLWFTSFRINKLLVVCGLWLAYQESVKIP